LWSLPCAGKPMTSKQRRAHFSSAHSRKGRCYDTDHVWTFQVYEHIMDYSTFLLNMPLLKFDMVQVRRQPAQRCAFPSLQQTQDV
jgi:hypothetical protein